MSLEPLTRADVDELLVELLPSVSGEFRQRVATTAEGNPFFAEEIVGHLLDEGILTRGEQGIEEARIVTSVTIPDSVNALLGARVDALPPEEKRGLQDAAVIGRIFWRTALDSMEGGGRSASASLAALEARGLIVARPQSSFPGQTEFAFRHPLTREVAYRSIPKARRARAHAKLATWIEELVGDRRPEYVELLAHHYEAAASPEAATLAWPRDQIAREDVRAKGVTALLEAGRAARTRFSIDAAVHFAERALELADGDAEQMACLELRAEAAHAGIRAEDAWSAYLEALEIARRIGDTEAASRLRANATLLWTRYGGAFHDVAWKPTAEQLLESGLSGIDEDSLPYESAALLIGRSMASQFGMPAGSPEDRRQDAEKAASIAEALGSQHLLSHALDAVAWNIQTQGFCRSARTAERMLDATRVIADRIQAHELLVTAAFAFTAAGRFKEAQPVGEEAAREARHLAPHHQLHGAAAESASLLPTGQLDRVLEATDHVVDVIHEEDDRTCNFGRQALLARVVSLFEANEQRAATDTLALFDQATPRGTPPPWSNPSAAEVLRPFVGLEGARERARRDQRSLVVAEEVVHLRAALQLSAVAGEWRELERLSVEARMLAPASCAPYLAWIANWADAVRLAVAGRSGEAIQRTLTATGALAEYGEHYRAGRLLVDLLPFLDPPSRGPLAEEAVARLEPMGAFASASEARDYAS